MDKKREFLKDKMVEKLKIITIVGARPQFIKASALSRLLAKKPQVDEIIVHTGQHFDANMSAVFFAELGIPSPAYFLDIHGNSHGHMTGRMLASIEDILIKEKPHAVIVYGDTNSTLAGALAASKLHIPIMHIEAGLRSYNRNMPEEINRVLTDHMSNLLFCPTQQAVHNLKKEGINQGVYHVGDIMFDATLFAKNSIKKNRLAFEKKFDFITDKFGLLTIHRQESTQDENFFKKLVRYAETIAQENNCKLIFPVHPRIQKWVEFLQNKGLFYITDPISYYDMHYLLSRAVCVLTDSGGLQKEAYFHRVPCITLRSETEWVETIDMGWNKLWSNKNYTPQQDILDYGDGDTSEKIVNLIMDNFK